MNAMMVVGADGDVCRVDKGEVVDGIAPSASRETRGMLIPTTFALHGVYWDFFGCVTRRE